MPRPFSGVLGRSYVLAEGPLGLTGVTVLPFGARDSLVAAAKLPVSAVSSPAVSGWEAATTAGRTVASDGTH
ncbi:MAG: hypothetical protein ACRDS0_01265 [Pseudonocardiaceae bacterium]